jgi:MFS family permease
MWGLSVTQLHIFLLVDVVQAGSIDEASRWLTWSSFVDTGGVVVSTIIAGWLADGAWGRRTFVYVSTILYVTSFAVLPQTRPGDVSFFLFVPTLLFGVAHGIQKSVDFAILVDVIDRHPQSKGTYVSVWITAGSIGSAIGSYSFGPILDLFPAHRNTSGAIVRINMDSNWQATNGTELPSHGRLGYVVTYSIVASACMLASALAVWSIADGRIRRERQHRTRVKSQSASPIDDIDGADTSAAADTQIRPQRLVVTGGFFDGSADGFIAVIKVGWSVDRTRSSKAEKRSHVSSMQMESMQVVSPPIGEELMVRNKGLGGACWHAGQLWSCFPNQVVVFDPPTLQCDTWQLVRTIDDGYFNDLHHVCVGDFGVLIANTGLETVDLFTKTGVKQSRTLLISASLHRERLRDATNTNQDFRVYDTKAKVPHVQHVNHVAVIHPSPTTETGAVEAYVTTFGNPEESDPSKRYGGISRVEFQTGSENGQSSVVARFDPPHGFVHDGAIDVCKRTAGCGDVLGPATEQVFAEKGRVAGDSIIMWMTTVVGELLVVKPRAGQVEATVLKKWRLYDRYGCAKGWTRGLCLSSSGAFVGTTAVRPNTNAAAYVRWPWDLSESCCTAITFAPFDETVAPVILKIELRGDLSRSERSKIFSILPFPSK